MVVEQYRIGRLSWVGHRVETELYYQKYPKPRTNLQKKKLDVTYFGLANAPTAANESPKGLCRGILKL